MADVTLYEHDNKEGRQRTLNSGDRIDDLGDFSDITTGVETRGSSIVAVLYDQFNCQGNAVVIQFDNGNCARLQDFNDRTKSCQILNIDPTDTKSVLALIKMVWNAVNSDSCYDVWDTDYCRKYVTSNVKDAIQASDLWCWKLNVCKNGRLQYKFECKFENAAGSVTTFAEGDIGMGNHLEITLHTPIGEFHCDIPLDVLLGT